MKTLALAFAAVSALAMSGAAFAASGPSLHLIKGASRMCLRPDITHLARCTLSGMPCRGDDECCSHICNPDKQRCA
jgi:hypothetical protein